MQWRLAQSLVELRDEVNAKWPKRSKDSDGSIGDASHASRSSDHNPWITDPPGPHVVSAIDITHDPASGCDSYSLAEFLRLSGDPRIKYIISNRKIASAQGGWAWRKYSGANPHNHHCHISVVDVKRLYDSTKSWSVAVASTMPTHDEPQLKPAPATLRIASQGPLVGVLQAKLHLLVDNRFGLKTEKAVIDFQKSHGLHADGVVGPQTWKALK